MHLLAQQELIFRTFLVGAGDLEVHLVLLDRILRVTTKESAMVNFFEEKAHKSWLRLSVPPKEVKNIINFFGPTTNHWSAKTHSTTLWQIGNVACLTVTHAVSDWTN